MKLVSLTNYSADQSNLLVLNAALNVEIESLSKQLISVQANLATESQRKARQMTVKPHCQREKAIWISAMAARGTRFYENLSYCTWMPSSILRWFSRRDRTFDTLALWHLA